MKMENEIQAPADCVIQEVMVTQGVSVNVGDTLIVLSS
jgi:biotin carboxyl carrier protein